MSTPEPEHKRAFPPPPPPSRCKLTTYESLFSACAAAKGLALHAAKAYALVAAFVFGSFGLSTGSAQIVIGNDTVLLLNNDFNFNLGTGFLDVQWTGSGGFAALSGDHYVKLNNSTATLNWDATNFVGADNALIFGTTNAADTVIWDKRLNINVARARIRVIKGLQAEATLGNPNIIPAVPVAVLNQELTGNGQLWIEGDGLIEYRGQYLNPTYTGKLAVVGAELRYESLIYSFINASKIEVGGGGKFTQSTVTLSTVNSFAPQLRAGPATNLYGATVKITQESDGGPPPSGGPGPLISIPDIHIKKGSNQFEYGYYHQHPLQPIRVATEFIFPSGKTTSTINIVGTRVNSPDLSGGLFFKIFNNYLGTPWAPYQLDILVPKVVLQGDVWAYVAPPNSGYNLSLLVPSYYIRPYSYNQDIQHTDIGQSQSYTETTAKSIKTLRIGKVYNDTGEVTAIVNNDTLTITLGGILKRMGPSPAKFQTLKEINTPAGVNLVVHNYSDGALTLEGKLNLGNDGLVKAGKGDLYLRGGPYIFNGNTITGTSHINEGSAYLDQDVYLGATAIGGTIRVAFGAEAPGRLIVARNEQIADTSTVVLDAVAIDGEGGISRHLPVFQIGNAVRVVEHIHTLRVEGGGVIRFSGAASGTQTTNQLFIQALQIPTIPNANGSLFVQNWIDGVTYFLISRAAPNFMAALARIHFQGWDPGSKLRDYDANNWEIIPMGAPEPATYGAILGVVGLGLVTWRKRTLRQRRCAQNGRGH